LKLRSPIIFQKHNQAASTICSHRWWHAKTQSYNSFPCCASFKIVCTYHKCNTAKNGKTV